MRKPALWSALLLVLLIAAGLRFHQLGTQSFWNDEGNSYIQATRDFASIAANAGRDIHPPGYYWLLAVWRGLVGESEFALRSLSAFASILTVAVTFALGRRLYGTGAGLIAAGLVALNGFSIYYAQEARMYALLAFWGAASMLALTAFTRQPNARRGLALGLLNAAGLYTQYAFPFVMLAQGLLAILWLLSLRQRAGFAAAGRGLLAYVLANLLALGLYAPWLPVALPQITSWPNTGEPVAPAQAIGVLLGWLAFGPAFTASSSASLAMINLLLAFGLLPLRGVRGALYALLLPVLWVMVGLGLFLAFGLLRESNIKLLLPAQVGLALWLARGLWVIWHFHRHRAGNRQLSQWHRSMFRLASGMAGAWLVFNLGQTLPPLYSDPAYQRDDYRGLVAQIAAAEREGDVIVLDAPNQDEVVRYYYHGALPVVGLPPGLGGNDDETRAAVDALMTDYERVFVVFWGEAERDPNRVVETMLDQHAYELGDVWFGDVRLARYATAAEFAEAQVLDVPFGESITLQSVAFNSNTLTADDALQVQLIWQTDTALTTRYKVFVQLLNPDGTLAAQHDSEPGGGLTPTTTWTPNSPVTDNHGLSLAGLAPGDYTLIVGVYDLNDPSARLETPTGDYYELGSVTLR